MTKNINLKVSISLVLGKLIFQKNAGVWQKICNIGESALYKFICIPWAWNCIAQLSAFVHDNTLISPEIGIPENKHCICCGQKKKQETSHAWRHKRHFNTLWCGFYLPDWEISPQIISDYCKNMHPNCQQKLFADHYINLLGTSSQFYWFTRKY